MVASPTKNQTPQPKAISALLPHAISLDQSGDQEMVDAIFHLSKSSTPWRLLWRYIERYTINLLNNPASPSLNRATVFLSPFAPLGFWDENSIARWATQVLAVPYSEKVGWSVVSTLLQLAKTETLRPYIPIDIWALVKQQPSLPPVCGGRDSGNDRALVHHVRGLEDLNILKSYFLLVWSEWSILDDSGFAEMQVSIREDFGGIGMLRHRADLIKRLDHVLTELGRGLGHLRTHRPRIGRTHVLLGKKQYGALRKALLEADQKAMKYLAGMFQVDRFQ
jgi:hypothetical protein